MICKTAAEFEGMRTAARMTAEVLRLAEQAVQPGMSTHELDGYIHSLITGYGATPCFLGYHGFPGAACISINDQVIHGIPGPRIIKDGDIVSIDVGVRYNDFCGDSALTVPVGKVDPETRRLLAITKQSLEDGIAAVKPKGRLSDISHAVQQTVESNGCSVVREFVGHGIGRRLHEEPQVPNFGAPNRGTILRPGLVLCIEPMVNLGRPDVQVLADGWTVVTKDNKPSAHFEHMVLVTAEGVEILTLR